MKKKETSGLVEYVYAVYDVKAGCYFHPYFVSRDEVAIRMFADVVNDNDTIIGKHPEDFTLFKIASWYKVEGRIEPHSVHESLAVGIHLVKQAPLGFEDADEDGILKDVLY